VTPAAFPFQPPHSSPPLTQELAARGWQRDEAGKLVAT
jgi:hypothetical protein